MQYKFLAPRRPSPKAVELQRPLHPEYVGEELYGGLKDDLKLRVEPGA